MDSLPFILITMFFVSLILSLLSLSKKKSAKEIVNEMGIGYNLGYLFDCYSDSKEIKTPDEQITLLGNKIPTKKMISSIKKSGFKTIRFPITWMHFIDDYGNINSSWLEKIKQVVNLIINSNMYCIINVYGDADIGNWLLEEENSLDKYINIWRQISEEFKIYDDHLIFESMNEIETVNRNEKYLTKLNNLNQVFVDTVRNSDGYNSERLLIVSGLSYTSLFIPELIFPNDISNKLGVSFHYYHPIQFSKIPENSSLVYFEEKSGYQTNITSESTLGN